LAASSCLQDCSCCSSSSWGACKRCSGSSGCRCRGWDPRGGGAAGHPCQPGQPGPCCRVQGALEGRQPRHLVRQQGGRGLVNL
jgi:hypothetical protein